MQGYRACQCLSVLLASWPLLADQAAGNSPSQWEDFDFAVFTFSGSYEKVCELVIPQWLELESRGKVEKHASELDLNCESYEDGIDWSQVRQQLFTFLRKPSDDHDFLASLLATGRKRSDCYIGLCCLGYLAIIFMPPEKRLKAASCQGRKGGYLHAK